MGKEEILKYGFYHIEEETPDLVLNYLKEYTRNLEIKNLEYFRGQLNNNLQIIIEKISSMTNEKVKDFSEKVLFRFYYNRFLFYLTMDAIMLSKECEQDYKIRGIFLHYSKKDGYSIDKISADRWIAEEFTIPLILTTLTKTINSKWIRDLFDTIREGRKPQSNNNKLNPFEDLVDPEKIELISKIKTCRDVLINENDKNPYALTRICKKMGERYKQTHYNTLIYRMIKHNLPTNIKEFTKIYG